MRDLKVVSTPFRDCYFDASANHDSVRNNIYDIHTVGLSASSEGCGDFSCVRTSSKSGITGFIGDLVSHGNFPGEVACNVKQKIDNIIDECRAEDCFDEVNELIYETHEKGKCDFLFATMVGYSTNSAPSITVLRAGHPEPIVLNSMEKGMVNALAYRHISDITVPVGVVDPVDYDSSYVEKKMYVFNRGSRAVFYTDGFEEMLDESNYQLGRERLEAIVKGATINPKLSSQEVCQEILEGCARVVGEKRQGDKKDDMTLVCVTRLR